MSVWQPNKENNYKKCDGCKYHNQLINLCEYCSRNYSDLYEDEFSYPYLKKEDEDISEE